MRRAENSKQTRRIILGLTTEEYSKIESKFKASTCRNITDYTRKHLCDKPIVVTYRNQSLDDFMEETIVLRKELQTIGNNVNEVIKKLHTLQKLPEVIELLVHYQLEKNILSNKIDTIKQHIDKIAKQWLQ